MNHKGLRYNSGKSRWDLIPYSTINVFFGNSTYNSISASEVMLYMYEWLDQGSDTKDSNPILEIVLHTVAFMMSSEEEEWEIHSLNHMANVLAMGAQKYEHRNWERGMSWSNVGASFLRHYTAYLTGEVFDTESELPHLAHCMCNLAFLIEYYNIYPQGDDRPHNYLKIPKIGLDVDDVIADFITHWTNHHGSEVPESWAFDRRIVEKLERVKDDQAFWLNIPVKTKASDIPFEPHCYITSRCVDTSITEEWLDKNGFPTMPVYTVGTDQSKVEVAKQAGVEIFIDDRYHNFRELNNAGICTFLFDADHNKRYNVGYKRITNVKDVLKHIS